jgi:hypothetical protein
MTQRATVLGMLLQAGPEGVSVRDLIYRHGITRAAAIVHDLREDGYSIRTVDEGQLDDGRQSLARYVLSTEKLQVKPPPSVLDEQIPLAPAKEIVFECGCVRSADGRSWRSRCDKHSRVATEPQESVQW